MSMLRDKIRAYLGRPQTNYYMLLLVSFVLVAFGLVMVQSSSMVVSYAQDSSAFAEFLKQAAIVFVGLIGMWFAMRLRPTTIQMLAPWMLAIAFVLLIAVLFIGVGGEEVGSNSWIRLGPVGVQPSEAAKLALAVWGATVVSKAMRQTHRFNSVLGPFLTVSAAILALVLLQKDLGMMLTVGIVVVAIMFFSGVNSRALLAALAVIAVTGIASIVAQSFRSARISTWLSTLRLNFPDSTTQGSAYQSYQGILSLSDGGLTGAGLGQSRAKWFYLPEAKNDFIFAVIGEELGILGTIGVVVLFALLGWFGIRTAMAQVDPFLRLLAATLTVGIVAQAFYNMGYVVGFFPMTGVQLPLISAGGSSAIITLVSLGLLCNCARHEPAAISSMQHEGRCRFDRIFMLPEPQPYVPGIQRRVERRTTTEHYGEPVTRQQRSAGRSGQDVRRERDRVEQSMQRVGGAPRRGYDGARRQTLPPSGSVKRRVNPSNRSRRR
ncbi:cell division protein FtsW [Corynebacterium falsenii DSM 44353]|uniref:Probable peptidoglycan glycosyltransferase FtsW n=2 Tax=Corynebacterium falsenii TaxID=108486 RepID=A0A418Q7L6_9CORY|nr:putative peptidoglycan glycosyltransferase FtsW [Corynebacterium falsenii]AHI02931.1 cell division protein FtsW [Corynebacterium falsenii DSM 44353]RIX35268.1 cell division protein FtsW [Corynebacterium falsenii]UBI03643.1 putative lipid II flippase FtsW [Corynebacterium falsenii]